MEKSKSQQQTQQVGLRAKPSVESLSDMAPIPELDDVNNSDVIDTFQPPKTQRFFSESTSSSPPPSASSQSPVSPGMQEDPGPQVGRRRSIIKEPGSRPTMRKKTVSFSRLPSEASVKNSSDCIALMRTGHQFVKMRSNSRVYNRLYWFDDVSNCLRWEPSKKDSGKARIDLASIGEVRSGKTTDLFVSSDISTHFPEECSFSIIYADGKTLDLIANSADDANVWVTGLRCLMSGQDVEGLRMRSDARDTWLCAMFDGADINGDGFLDEDESLKLLTSLSDGIRELRIKQKLQEHVQLRGSTDRSRLSKDEFVEIFKDVATRPEIYFLLARFASRDDRLTVNDLLVFLESEQGVSDVTEEMCEELIAKYEPSKSLQSIPALGIDGFTKYLMSDECGLMDPRQLQVCEDMTQPLSHYFIASSHNTYLMEDQVSGPSSVSAYVRALLRCCRCVELDCWDGTDGEPVVTHGHTPTNSIPFRQVVEAIGESAFRNSSYPVIVSVENHCSEKQQLVMAEHLTQVLGDAIYKETLSGDQELLPSPENLKNRILIRTKRIPPGCKDDVGYASEDDEGQEVEDKIATSMVDLPVPVDPPPRPQRRGALVKPLSDLVSICACATFGDDFEAHRDANNCSVTCSIHEQQAMKYVETCPDQFAIHNQKYLTRVYPSAARFDSSNFNPQDYWNCGVQIAALNYQTPGLMMDINDGRFSTNGGCGYVLKPDVMRQPMSYYNTQHSDVIPGVTSKILHLRVISGQNFPKPRGGGAKGHVIDPYVLIELFSVPADCAEQRTRTAPNNSGESPVFDESFEFRLTLPQLALVRFVVLDDEFIGDEFIGQYTIPLESMRPGYRHLRLRSIFDEPLDDATLFIHVSVSPCDAVVVSPQGGALMTSQGVQSGGTLKKRSSASQQKRLKKTRSRRDIDFVVIRDCAIPKFDDMFRRVDATLRHATSMRDAYRVSLSNLRDACALATNATVKQCVRTVAQRSRQQGHDLGRTPGHDLARNKRSWSVPDESEVEGEDPRKRTATSDAAFPRRHTPDPAPEVALLRHERRILLEVRGAGSEVTSSAGGEFWRKVGPAMDALVSDCLALLDSAPECCKVLAELCESVQQIYQDIPKLLNGGEPAALAHAEPGPLVNGGSPAAPAPGAKKSGGKSSQKKKQQQNSGESERKRRLAAQENVRWNHSAIKGQLELLEACRKEASECLEQMWQTGLRCGIAKEGQKAESLSATNGLDKKAESADNRNGNNNSGVPPKPNGTKNRFGVSKPPFSRSRATPTPKVPKHEKGVSPENPVPFTPL